MSTLSTFPTHRGWDQTLDLGMYKVCRVWWKSSVQKDQAQHSRQQKEAFTLMLCILNEDRTQSTNLCPKPKRANTWSGLWQDMRLPQWSGSAGTSSQGLGWSKLPSTQSPQGLGSLGFKDFCRVPIKSIWGLQQELTESRLCSLRQGLGISDCKVALASGDVESSLAMHPILQLQTLKTPNPELKG